MARREGVLRVTRLAIKAGSRQQCQEGEGLLGSGESASLLVQSPALPRLWTVSSFFLLICKVGSYCLPEWNQVRWGRAKKGPPLTGCCL